MNDTSFSSSPESILKEQEEVHIVIYENKEENEKKDIEYEHNEKDIEKKPSKIPFTEPIKYRTLYKKEDNDILSRRKINKESFKEGTPIIKEYTFSDRIKNMINTHETKERNSQSQIKDEHENEHDTPSSTNQEKSYDVVPLGESYMWNEEIENQFRLFRDICKVSSAKCLSSAKYHNKVYKGFQITTIVISSLTFTTSVSSLEETIRNIMTTTFSIVITMLTSIQGFLSFSKKSETEANIGIEFDRMSRSINLELSKDKKDRYNPFKYIRKLENHREKLLRKLGVDD